MKTPTFYQAAHLSDEESKGQFIVRKKEFERVISEIKEDDMLGSIQHYIFIGQRGSGKSTLLRRIEAEINTDESLHLRLEAVNLSEEQAGIYRLHDLWERVWQELNEKGFEIEKVKWEEFGSDLTTYARALYMAMQKALQTRGKKLVLLLDNIDRILENIKTEDNHLFRELLINYKDVRIIGGSTRLSEHHWKYDQPFYEFFSIIRLDALPQDELKELLIFWGECMNKPELEDFVKKHPGRLNAVRILSDGMPRTMLNFVELLVNRPEQHGYDYLKFIIDRATPVYQERLGVLSPLQQKVVLEMSFFWDAVKVAPLSKVARVESKTLSALLNQLVEMQIVEKIKGKGKNFLYRLQERFFNLWLIMTQGGPRQKSQVKWLTIFLETWYDEDELKNLYSQYCGELAEGKITADHAMIMTKALAHSKYLSVAERDDLLERTAKIIGNRKEHLDLLPAKTKEIYLKVDGFIKKKHFDDAFKELENIEQQDGIKQLLFGIIYHLKGEKKEAERSYLNAIKEGNKEALNNLGSFYQESGRMEEAEELFLRAIESKQTEATYNLAVLYYEVGRKEEAEKYYIEAVKKGHKMAANNLGNLYYLSGRMNEAEKLYVKGVEDGNDIALNNLANIYEVLGRREEAEKYYFKAIEKGIVRAHYNLAILYKKAGRFELAEKYFLSAIEKNDTESLNELAVFYENTGSIVKAEKYYLLAIDKGVEKAFYNLGNLYCRTNRLDEAEKLYLQAIEKGQILALNNLANLYSDLGRNEDAEKYYVEAIEKGDAGSLVNLANLYSNTGRKKEAEKYHLIAVEKGQLEALNNLAAMYYFDNQNPDKAYNLIAEYNSKSNQNIQTALLEIIISIWSGRPERLEITETWLNKVIETKNIRLLGLFLNEILVHHQRNLVWQLFHDDQFGQTLKDMIRPYYHVTARLLNNGETEEELLAQAPEFKETVDSIYNNIIKRQEFYYGRNK